jgi:hypothetical protein
MEPVRQQVKLFKGIESEVQPLENEINAWIRKSRARVISITGNIAPQSRRYPLHGGPDVATITQPRISQPMSQYPLTQTAKNSNSR